MRCDLARQARRPRAPVPTQASSRCAESRRSRLAPGQTLFHEGGQAGSFYEIKAGTVRCYRVTREGRRHIFRFAGPGDALGLGAEAAYDYSAEAVTMVTAERHSLLGLDRLMDEDAAFRRRVLRVLRFELSLARQLSMMRGCLSADGKVAAFLLERAAVIEDGDCIRIPMTRTDIADYLGIAIETVSRKINEFRSAGLIELVGPRDLRILDRNRLRTVAEDG